MATGLQKMVPRLVNKAPLYLTGDVGICISKGGMSEPQDPIARHYNSEQNRFLFIWDIKEYYDSTHMKSVLQGLRFSFVLSYSFFPLVLF